MYIHTRTYILLSNNKETFYKFDTYKISTILLQHCIQKETCARDRYFNKRKKI